MDYAASQFGRPTTVPEQDVKCNPGNLRCAVYPGLYRPLRVYDRLVYPAYGVTGVALRALPTTLHHGSQSRGLM